MRTQSLPSFKLPPLSLLISLLFPAAPVVAGTHLLEAAYVETWTDLKITKENDQFELQRTYSSRSIHRGLFGFGWCTNIEKSIRRESGTLQINDCHPISKSTPLTLSQDKDHFVATYHDKKELYDGNTGRLIAITAGRITIKIEHDSRGRPTQLCQGVKCLAIHYMPQTDFISKISEAFKAHAIYNYQDDDLVLVAAQDRRTSFTYDHFHNLTEVQSDNFLLKLRYEDSEDHILSIEQGPVKETYSYSTLDSQSKRIQITQVTQFLRGQKVFSQSYQFHFSRDKDTGALVLNTIQTKEAK